MLRRVGNLQETKSRGWGTTTGLETSSKAARGGGHVVRHRQGFNTDLAGVVGRERCDCVRGGGYCWGRGATLGGGEDDVGRRVLLFVCLYIFGCFFFVFLFYKKFEFTKTAHERKKFCGVFTVYCMWMFFMDRLLCEGRGRCKRHTRSKHENRQETWGGGA